MIYDAGTDLAGQPQKHDHAPSQDAAVDIAEPPMDTHTKSGLAPPSHAEGGDKGKDCEHISTRNRQGLPGFCAHGKGDGDFLSEGFLIRWGFCFADLCFHWGILVLLGCRGY